MPLTWPNYNEARSPNSWFRGLQFVSHFSFFFCQARTFHQQVVSSTMQDMRIGIY